MILEATRIIADWLADATYGVNAVRTTVPKDTGVTDFPAVTVLDSTRDGRVARGGVPNLTEAEFPALLVTPADQPVTQNRAGIQPGGWFTATVLIRYAVKAMDTALAERHASQTIKCVVRQMPLLVQTPAGETLRNGYTTRTEVQFHAIEDLQLTTLYEADTDTLVTGGVLVTCLLKRL